MKVVTLFGTRPEIIRLSQVIKTLDPLCEHTLIHTGQNHDPALSDVFFTELQLRNPDVHLGLQTSEFGEQAGQILAKSSEVLRRIRPDRLLLLGDTNSGLASIVASRLRIPVFHMEAGNRCYDNRVPEEINRRVIDHTSDVLLPYTHRSKENLLREGIERRRIFVIGNPIREVIESHRDAIHRSRIHESLNVQSKGYALATVHRAENVDEEDRLLKIVAAFDLVADTLELPVIVSVHPRTADRLSHSGLAPRSPRVRLIAPLGLLDFVRLEQDARVVLSDSGTVQEECCIFGVPNVTMRDVTERPETIECGSNILSGVEPSAVLAAVQLVLALHTRWQPPEEYMRLEVASTVARIVCMDRADACA